MDNPLSFTAPEPSALQELLPAYEISQLIAQGGMGAVYRGKQKSLDREVAIKILPRELGADPAFRASFETEARAMARLNHPNLISVYDFGSVDGMPYIVMEFVAGKSLYHSAYGMQVDPMESARIIRDICEGLGHAHEAGIIHHDIKPANILLTAKVEPKIGDFGLAKPMDGGHAGLVMGTPGYAAPEVYTNPQQADLRSDIFAVGVMLHELLTGKRPDEVQHPASQLCGCSDSFDRIIAKATSPDISQRYQSARDLERHLDDILSGRQPQGLLTPTSAKPAGVPAPTAAPAAAAVPRGPRDRRGPQAAGMRAPSAAQMTSSRGKGIPGPVWAAIGAVVLVGGGLFIWKYDQKRKADEVEFVRKQQEEVDREAAAKQAEIDAKLAESKRMEAEFKQKEIDDKAKKIEEDRIAAAVRSEQAAKEAAARKQQRETEKAANEAETAQQTTAFKTKLEESRVKAKDAVTRTIAERDAGLEANVKEFKGDLDSSLNMIFRSDRQPWEASFKTLKGMVEGNRIPKLEAVTAAETNGDLRLSPTMRTVLGSALSAEARVDALFTDKIRKIAEAYTKKIDELLTEFPAATDAIIAEKLAASGSEKKFIGYLNGQKISDGDEEEEDAEE